MLSDGVVVIEIIHCFGEEILLGMDGKQSRDLKLFIISTMGTFDMSVFLRAGRMVLDYRTTKARQEFSEFDEFKPGLTTKLFSSIHGEDDRYLNVMTSEP